MILLQSLTINESRTMDFLIRNFNEKNSINEIARRLNLSPRGAYKILKKLEKIEAITPEKIGNAIYYKTNFNDEIGIKLSEFVLVQNELNPYLQVQEADLKRLRKIASACVLFGSVIEKGREANDIDVMFVIKKDGLKKLASAIKDIQVIKIKKIHRLVQTKEDLAENIKKKDKVIMSIIKTGKVLWGAEIIVEAIKNGTS